MYEISLKIFGENILINKLNKGDSMDWTTLASDESIQKIIDTFKQQNITVEVAGSGEEAKQKALSFIPQGANVMSMSSVTADTIGITKEIIESGKYVAVKEKLKTMDHATQGKEMKQMGSVPDVGIGSVHAISEDGHILIASRSGSQLPAYTYGASKVILVVGAQKIVKTLQDGIKRVYEHSLPLESVRSKKAYGTDQSYVNYLLLLNRQDDPNRVHVIIVKEVIGF
ncbi:hypothetical protein C5B42_02400 [Candidatus Cerribacteria bacterium 'Amazon FNV 2010 28 9']|uniref:LUD domain-containing protein n=1 Tax=Candidatus Cerribacteria bacterium 'Amazon FNV 2010 28 9' TaxID=2081795 RepID=A0A317JU69_9BACT|nr:MAG: hypothetical protein C5B42_02400 [Candidatus Cerribacteria bacterium 'Amazon FNV 2010 28 9']